jgi:hypothetical protein
LPGPYPDLPPVFVPFFKLELNILPAPTIVALLWYPQLAADLAHMHGDRHFGLDGCGSLHCLFMRHDILAADWQQSDIEFQSLHLRNEVGITRMVTSDTLHRNQIADMLGLLGMKGYSGAAKFGEIIGWQSLNGYPFYSQLLSGVNRLYLAGQFLGCCGGSDDDVSAFWINATSAIDAWSEWSWVIKIKSALRPSFSL